jgi:hypothetical protein
MTKKSYQDELSLRERSLEGLAIILRSLLRAANLWQGGEEHGVHLDEYSTKNARACYLPKVTVVHDTNSSHYDNEIAGTHFTSPFTKPFLWSLF